MARDAGQQIGPRARRDGEAKIGGHEFERIRGGKRKRCLAQLKRVDAEEQVVHHRVHHKDRIEDLAGLDFGLLSDVHHQLVETFAHGLCHFQIAAFVHHGVADAAHEVFAKADLRVHEAGGGHHFAGGEIAEVSCDGGGAKIHGEAKHRPFEIAGPERDHARGVVVVALMQCGGHGPVAFAQKRLQRAQKVGVDRNMGVAGGGLQRGQKPLEIAGGLVHVGLFHLNIAKRHGGVERDVTHLGAFAHHLFVNLTFRWNINHNVALNRRLTAQTAALGEAALVVIALLDRVPFRQRIIRNGHAVFGKFAIRGGDLTFGADAAPAANTVQVDAKLAGCRQNRCANGEVSAFAGGGENHEWIAAHRSALGLFACL